METIKRILSLGFYKPKDPADLSVDPSKYGRLRHICIHGIPYLPEFKDATSEEKARLLNETPVAFAIFDEPCSVSASDIDAALFGLDKQMENN